MNYLRNAGSALWHASGASSIVGGAQQIYQNSGRGGTWSGMGEGVARMAMGGAALATLPSAPLRGVAMGVASQVLSPMNRQQARETLSRENVGSHIKRAGKALGNQRMIEHGRNLQYGHLPPEELLKQHPSAFLRKYAIQSDIQPSESSGGQSRTNETFHLRRDLPGNILNARYMPQITDASGVSRAPAQYFHLHTRSSIEALPPENRGAQVGNEFNAAYLPMLQARTDNLPTGKDRFASSIEGYDQGRVRNRNLDRRGESVTLTTQLSGCSVTMRGGDLLHVRPHESGEALNRSLPQRNTFGRNDYPGGYGVRAFVMTKKKPDGSTRLYFQKHDYDSGTITSGRKTISK